MMLTINQPNGQEMLTQPIPAHEISVYPTDNGDHSGMLYQTAIAPFTITALDTDTTVYIQGRIAYYVGPSMWNKYNYLNAISTAKNINVDTHYSCKNGGYGTTFDNRIIINGKPNNALPFTKFPDEVSCEGFAYSSLSDDHQQYIANCHDGSSSTFSKINEQKGCLYGHCWIDYYYSNGVQDIIPVRVKNVNLDMVALQAGLDKKVGNTFCASWHIPEDEPDKPPCGFPWCI